MTAQQLLRDAKWKFRDFPTETATLDDGTEIQCLVISGLVERTTLEIGGMQEEPTVTIVIQLKNPDNGADIFTTIPDGTVTLNGRNYRVDRTEKDPFGYTMQIDLMTPHK
jgi:hypothetical protein